MGGFGSGPWTGRGKVDHQDRWDVRGLDFNGVRSPWVSIDGVRIDIAWVPTKTTGGARPYWICSGCLRRARYLYWATGRLRCWRCSKFSYQTWALPGHMRVWERYARAIDKLPRDKSRPIGMRVKQYEKLLARVLEFDGPAWREAGYDTSPEAMIGGYGEKDERTRALELRALRMLTKR